MGFFDKTSSSNASSAAAQTSQTGEDQASNLNISGLSTGKNSQINVTATDYGAINSALNFAGRAFDAGSEMVDQASEIAYRGLDNTTKLAYDGVNKSLNFAAQVASDNTAFAGRILDKQTTANLEFLGEVSNFADLSRQTAKEQAAFSERQTAAAISAVTSTQAGALDQVARFGQDAQNATMKALDYVFESTKSETARLSEISMKWIVVAAVAVFVAPFLLKVK